jgi:hypothetical protein
VTQALFVRRSNWLQLLNGEDCCSSAVINSFKYSIEKYNYTLRNLVNKEKRKETIKNPT